MQQGKRRARAGLAAMTCVLLAGCVESPFAKPGSPMLARAEPLFGKDLDQCLDDPRVLLAVTSPGSETDNFQGGCKDLVETLAGYDFANVESAFAKSAVSRSASAHSTQSRTDGRGANTTSTAETDVEYFRPPAEYARRRNEVVDALVAVSNRKCGRYAAMLKSFDGTSGSVLSVLSILSGGIGAIATSERAARLFSGGSAILGGSRAAVNETWFSNQTIHVLVAAFEKARERQQREITNRQFCPVDVYTVMDGVGDAMNYHASCSILVGLAETSSAVERSDQPGLEAMRRQLADLASIRRQADNLVSASFGSDGLRASSVLEEHRAATEDFGSKDLAVRRTERAITLAKIDVRNAIAAARSVSAGEVTDAEVESELNSEGRKESYDRLTSDLADAKAALEIAQTRRSEAANALKSLIDAENAAKQQTAILEQTTRDFAMCPYTTSTKPETATIKPVY